MNKGKVKWYNGIRGYGFIEADNGKDVFVHRTGLDTSVSDLETGQEVEFEIREGEKGLQAYNVRSSK
jgi:CspA family cold shock protein